MSLIIKGMKLPKNGEMKELTIGRAPNGSELIAIAHGDTTEFYKVVEIPTPHGRLIDADEIKEYAEWHCQRFIDGDYAEVGLTVDQINSFVRNAPTIIEAEVSE